MANQAILAGKIVGISILNAKITYIIKVEKNRIVESNNMYYLPLIAGAHKPKPCMIELRKEKDDFVFEADLSESYEKTAEQSFVIGLSGKEIEIKINTAPENPILLSDLKVTKEDNVRVFLS